MIIKRMNKNSATKASYSNCVAVPSDLKGAAKTSRRHFTAEYKLAILKQADFCREPGSLGALLRREGLYSSHINTWRRERDRGILAGLTPKKRGRKESRPHPLIAENTRLRKENDRLSRRLRQVKVIVNNGLRK